MKRRKIVALLLATVMATSAFSITACSKKDSKDKDSKKEKEEEEEAEETETSEAVTETEAAESTIDETEATQETEATEETTEIPEETEKIDATGTSANPNNDADAVAYSLFMDFVKNGSFDSNAKFAFQEFRYGKDDEVDSRWGLVVFTGDDAVAYAVIDGEVVETTLGYDWYPDYGSPLDVFLQLPMMIEFGGNKLVSSSEIDDGIYYGSLICSNEEGTKALVGVGTPIIIDEETYNSLDSVDSFTDVNGNTLLVEAKHDRELSLATSADSDLVYGWFVSEEDGTYILMSDSDFIPYVNVKLCFIDIAPDCEIEDRFCWLYGVGDTDPFVGANPEEPMTLKNSHLYNMLYNYEYANIYNGWLSGHSAILEPVEIKDGQIVNVVLGWR